MHSIHRATLRLVAMACLAFVAVAYAGGQTRTVRTPQGLLAAIQDQVPNIRLEPGDYDMSEIVSGSDSALTIEFSVTIEALDPANPPRLTGGGEGSNFRFATIRATDENPQIDVVLADLIFESFSVDLDGGVLSFAPEGGEIRVANVAVTDCEFRNNEARLVGGAISAQDAFLNLDISDSVFVDNTAIEGGAVYANGNVGVRTSEFVSNTAEAGSAIYAPDFGSTDIGVVDSQFVRNTATASGDGAAVVIRGQRRTDVSRNVFNNNLHFFNTASNLRIEAGDEGCVPFADLGCFNVFVDGNMFVHPPGNQGDVSIRQESGGVLLTNNVFKNIPENGFAVVFTSGRLVGLGVSAFGNVFDIDGFSPDGQKDLCRDNAGVGLFESLGFNISEDDTCQLDADGDRPSTDAMLADETEDGLVALMPGSPAIDGSLSDFLSGKLACSYKDIRGLGRPQDGDGDGSFECDIGPYEVQGGPDIGPAQSSAYFDPERGGEGVFVELFGNGLAFVAMFTYSSDGQNLVWFVGIGQVAGNSVVVDEFLQTSGGVFGPGFDASQIVRTEVAGLSLNFPTCEAASSPGRMSLQALDDSGFEDLLVSANRLSTIVPCSGSAPATSGRSGSFFDPARDGEGIFVQWLTDGRVIVIWYTYDPEGNQFWTISGDATVNGATVTANMLYPASTTGFGTGFDADEVDLQDWGTVTLTYGDCNSVSFNYDSSVAGFGQGNYDYVRLTMLDGTTCDL